VLIGCDARRVPPSQFDPPFDQLLATAQAVSLARPEVAAAYELATRVLQL